MDTDWYANHGGMRQRMSSLVCRVCVCLYMICAIIAVMTQLLRRSPSQTNRVLSSISLGTQDLVDRVQLGANSDKQVGPHEEWGLEMSSHAHKVHNLFSSILHEEGTHSDCFYQGLQCLCVKQAVALLHKRRRRVEPAQIIVQILTDGRFL